MGIVKEITLAAGTLYIWHITETKSELEQHLKLSETSQLRLAKMKREEQQKAFLAVRQVLFQLGIEDRELGYDTCGKPSLESGDAISISHSFAYALVAISKENIGIDIELKRDKVVRLKEKFCHALELSIGPEAYEEALAYFTEIWSVKEALYKMCDSRSLSFAQDMMVDVVKKEAEIKQGDFCASFIYQTWTIEDYVVVVSQKK